MAFYKQDIVDINLNTGNIYRSFLNHAIGYKNDDADRFGIRTFRDGEPVDLTGVSCQAVFMAPDGSNIALTSYGTVSGNVAYVTLPPACYNYEGQFCLSIQLVGGGVTGTMRIVDGMVVNTGASGTVAPTSAVPTYQEIIAQYNAMVAATAAANGAIAATYSQKTYAVGEYCIHDGGLYRCTTAITTAEAWNAAHWTATKIGPDVSDLKSALNDVEEEIFVEETQNIGVWYQGASSWSNGSNSTNNNIIRTNFMLVKPGYKKIDWDHTQFIVRAMVYTSDNISSYNQALSRSFDDFAADNGDISTLVGKYIKLNAGYVETATFAPSDVQNGDFTLVSVANGLQKGIDELDDVIENSTGKKEVIPTFEAKQILAQDGSHSNTNNAARLYSVKPYESYKIKVTSARSASWSTAGPLVAFYSADTAIGCDDSTLLLAGTRHSSDGTTYTETYYIPSGTKTILVQACEAYESSYGLPTVELYSISSIEDVKKINADIGSVTAETFTKSGSSNATLAIAHDIKASVPIMFYWTTTDKPTSTLNLFTRDTPSGSNVETVKSTAYPNTFYKFTPTQSASYLFLSAIASGTIYIFDGNTIYGDIAEMQNQIDTLTDLSKKEPLVRFNFSDIMYDPSAIFAENGEIGQIASWESKAQALSKVHAAFDALCSSGGAGYGYGERITGLYKSSASDEAQFDILAPSYVTSGVTQGETVTLNLGTDTSNNPVTYSYTYESSTDPYEVRLYKFQETNNALHTGNVNIPKKKLLLIGGTHGNEFCASINLYVFAKHLCTDYNNPDMLKLRSAFDVYIIPYLNGFGCQYRWNNQGTTSTGSRSNGHMVDINRNCETYGWVGATGTAQQITANFESKIANLGTNTFPGASAGSEFESQLVKAIVEWIQPDVVIDHHHNDGNSPIYAMSYDRTGGMQIYQAVTDIAYSYMKNFPEYYGNSYNLFLSSTVSPASLTAQNGYVTTMTGEMGVQMSATEEMPEAIAWSNGVIDASTKSATRYSSDAFATAEYTLLNVVLHLCQYAMEH